MVVALRAISSDAKAEIEALCDKYPTRLAAMLGALHIVQNELGSITEEAKLDVADILDVPPTRVQEAVTFYTMFYDRPIGRHTVKICRNLACQLRGADALIQQASDILGIQAGETTADGRITFDVEECLASCGTAPMLWHRHYDEKSKHSEECIVENLDQDKLKDFLQSLD